jgi:hypothetical protein
VIEVQGAEQLVELNERLKEAADKDLQRSFQGIRDAWELLTATSGGGVRGPPRRGQRARALVSFMSALTPPPVRVVGMCRYGPLGQPTPAQLIESLACGDGELSRRAEPAFSLR